MRDAWAWIRRLGRSLTGNRRDRDLDDELKFHLEMQTALEAARGTPPREAERAARLRLGGTEAIREAYRAEQDDRGGIVGARRHRRDRRSVP